MWSVLQISSALPFGPYQKRMHSHVVPILFRSALPFGPHDFQKCTPKWASPIYGFLAIFSKMLGSNSDPARI